MATRWGICSAGKICNDYCTALKMLPEEEHAIVAVAARKLESAKSFAEKFGISKAYGSYEELAQNPDVEIVYIGTIHPEHRRLSLMFLNAGKHVLCEKPMAMSVAGVQEVLKTAREKKLFFMEGFWSRFFPVYDQLRKELAEETLGNIHLASLRFCLPISGVNRITKKELGGGGLLDIGCYPLMAANLVFGGRPERIIVEGNVNENDVDEEGCIILRYPGGKMASLLYSTTTICDDNSMTIIGTKGSIQVYPPFWCPTKMRTPKGELEFPLPKERGTFFFHNSTGFCYEARCVRDCLQKGLKECPKMPHKDSEDIMFTIEAILEQLGVKYDSA